ncbi:unnamed protein product [Auanema sp. JU1783]|nr:unnamed protein product [Auanema sp. JU1783]
MPLVRNPRFAHRTRPSSIIPCQIVDISEIQNDDEYCEPGEHCFYVSVCLDDTTKEEEPIFKETPKKAKQREKRERVKKKLDSVSETFDEEKENESEHEEGETRENLTVIEEECGDTDELLNIKEIKQKIDDDEDFSLLIEDQDGNPLVQKDERLVLASEDDLKSRKAKQEKARNKTSQHTPLVSPSDTPDVSPTENEKNKEKPSTRRRRTNQRGKTIAIDHQLEHFREVIRTVARSSAPRKSYVVCNVSQMWDNHHPTTTPVRPPKTGNSRASVLSPIRRDSRQFANFPLHKSSRLSVMMPQMCSTPILSKSSAVLERDKSILASNSGNPVMPPPDLSAIAHSQSSIQPMSPFTTQETRTHTFVAPQSLIEECSTQESNSFSKEKDAQVDNVQSTDRKTNESVLKDPITSDSIEAPRLRRDSSRKRKSSPKRDSSDETQPTSPKTSDLHTSASRSPLAAINSETPSKSLTNLSRLSMDSKTGTFYNENNDEGDCQTMLTNQNTMMFEDNGRELYQQSMLSIHPMNNITNMTTCSDYRRNTTMTKRNITIMRTDSMLDGSHIIPSIPFYLEDYEGEHTPLSHLLHIIDQKEVMGWSDLPKEMITNPVKLGEGAYGEVFKTYIDETPTALKIMPISAEMLDDRMVVNGEYIFTAEEVLPEVLITQQLSALNSIDCDFSTPNFIEVLKTRIVRGKYPAAFLKAFDIYADKNECYNERPSEYHTDDQLFLILGLSLGGKDLEKETVTNEKQFFSILFQLVLTLTIAEKTLEFEHRDLHLGNLLLEKCATKTKLQYKYNGNDFCLCTHGVKIKIIDFTLSRLKRDAITLFKDLEADVELFEGQGEYQYEIYRMMRKENKGDWSMFEPKSNLFWLHHMAHELLTKKNCPKITKKRKKELMTEMDKLLTLDSVTDILTNESFTWMVQEVLVKS